MDIWVQLDIKGTSFSHMAFLLIASNKNGQKWPKMAMAKNGYFIMKNVFK